MSDEQLEALEALGYFDRSTTPEPDKRNVTKARPGSFDGLNLYGSRNLAEAYLIDMRGQVLHKWSDKTRGPSWMHMELQPNGDLLVISKGRYVARLDWDSNILWKQVMGAHHDLTVASDGRIFVLSHEIVRYVHSGSRIPIMDDSIVILSPSGEVMRKQRLFPLLRRLVSRKRLDLVRQRTKEGVSADTLTLEGALADTTHINSIQILPQAIPSIAEAGSILLSAREINGIVILDADMRRLLWSWGPGEVQAQHHANLLDNGRIMVFDNGVGRRQSRVIEVNPATGEVEWSYTSPDFFTLLRGAAQKLPNGNVLITESDKGHAFEITPEGERVWEFWNPDVQGEDDPTRAVIYRMIRYPREYLQRDLPGSRQ